jgi:5-methyltetrahydrofolate--homocysteine methyltransferase
MDHQRLEHPPAPLPPFKGTRAETVDLAQVLPWLNRPVLYRGRWGYPARAAAGATAPVTAARPAEAVLAGLLERCREERLVEPQVVYGYFPCAGEGDDLLVLGQDEPLRFRFRRQDVPPHRCLADFFRPAANGGDLLALQVVSTGPGVAQALERAGREHRYLEMLQLHGFASALAEALAEWLHHRIRRELGLARDESGDPADAFRHRYRGRRYSFGYPACPNLEDQQLLFRLLKPERIGVTLNSRFQMVPEHSTSALVVHHPRAQHFAV